MTPTSGWAVQEEYHDVAGRLITPPRTSLDAVRAELERAGSGDAQPVVFLHPGDSVETPLEVVTEDGRTLLVAGSVGADVPLGYHTCDTPAGPRPLVVSPRRCHEPEHLRESGWAVQVYSARSARSWGIGDLGDLREFGRWARARGAGFALISPINAAAPVAPIESSPYLPVSRRWRNPVHLRVEDVPGAAELGGELDALSAAGRALNSAPTIDRDRIAALKLDALGRVFAAAPPGDAFAAWRRAQGAELERFATYCVIAESHGGDWRHWPSPLQPASSRLVAALAQMRAERVTFHAWLQWLVDVQLAEAATALPLMADLPIGVDPGGADVWADPDLFARGFSVGAPPDEFNTVGQDWAQPPWNPAELRARAYAPLVAVLRAGFGHAMGLRIDHVMGLFRLFWIPAGEPPHAGVYVRYPHDEILDIVALESVRARAVVVGEDLGTVEPLVHEAMDARGMLGYRLLYFTDHPAAELPVRALSAVTTHDLPTVTGLLTGSDTLECRSIDVPVNDEGMDVVRGRLHRAAGGEGDPAAVAVRAYRALAASPSMLVVAALEDAAGQAERPNIPGTTTALRPNWSVPLPRPLEEVLASPLAGEVAEALRRA